MSDQTEEGTETSEERLQWLRDHGVTVETPEERAQAKTAAANARLLKEGDPDTRTYRYVKIPAGMSDPLEELTAVVHTDHRGAGDTLMPLLAGHFSEGAVDAESLKQASIHNLTEGAGQMGLNSITPESITAAGGSAEPFRLSDSITMYLDAVGALKRLPINPRAAMLASSCGYGEGVAFHGDIYVGRKEPGSMLNIDFLRHETRPGTEWIGQAFGENMARQSAEGRTGGMSAEEISQRGGDGDGYTWTQSPDEVEVTIPAPKGTKGKSVDVKFKVAELTASIADGTELALKLFGRVAPDGCSWSISDGDVVLTLEKAEEGETWPTLSRD